MESSHDSTKMVEYPLRPLQWHWFVLLLMVPFAQPNDVLWGGRYLADGALFGLSALLVEVSVGCYCLLGHLQRSVSLEIEYHIINPA